MGDSLIGNAADPGQQKAAKRVTTWRRKQELGDLSEVLSRPEGRRLLWRLLEHCGTFRSVFGDPAVMAYKSGQQDLGHWLMGEIANCDERYLFTMMHEAQQRKVEEKAERDKKPDATTTDD